MACHSTDRCSICFHLGVGSPPSALSCSTVNELILVTDGGSPAFLFWPVFLDARGPGLYKNSQYNYIEGVTWSKERRWWWREEDRVWREPQWQQPGIAEKCRGPRRFWDILGGAVWGSLLVAWHWRTFPFYTMSDLFVQTPWWNRFLSSRSVFQ